MDLRPTTSNDEGEISGVDGLPSPIADHDTGSVSLDTAEGAHASRRQRSGLSLYLQHTLNIRRMRDATPEERIAALRRLRTVNRASHHGGSSTEDSSGEAARGNRLSMRVRDALRVRRRSEIGSHIDAPTAPATVEVESGQAASAELEHDRGRV